jgi:hypothetical protein
MRGRVCLVFALGWTAASAAAGQLEDLLQSRLHGAWVLTRTESYSWCDGRYTNNRVSAGGVTSKGFRRFVPGELGKIDKVDLKRARVDLLVSVNEPVLVERQEGPFELFDERSCKVELMVELPREVVKSGDPDAVLAELARVVEAFPSWSEARSSEGWNGRERRPYPPDYDQTLARYQVWHAEQLNAAVAARSDEAARDAARLVERMGTDPSYLAGFGAGVERGGDWYEDDCDDLLEASLVIHSDDPPDGVDDTKAWDRGYRDGQELAFNVLLVDRLAGCYVPVPALEDVVP